ncbi:MAG: DUF6036 family nucleotidyltransferase [Candidatus Nanopelagicales bacterium]
MTNLDAAGISRLLHALDAELAARGTTADVYLVGGAAIALSFDAARTTRDLDAVFVPTTQVRAAAEAVAEANGLAGDWLNDAVKGFVPPGTDAHQRVVFESPHLRVCVAGAEHLLAMKVAASRVEQDRGDLALRSGSWVCPARTRAISPRNGTKNPRRSPPGLQSPHEER